MRLPKQYSEIELTDHIYHANTYEAIIKLYQLYHWTESTIAELFGIEEDDVKATIEEETSHCNCCHHNQRKNKQFSFDD